MVKCRGFSIVLHDVHKGLISKSEVQAKVQTLAWRQYVIAEEPYNHQEGSHIHLFLQVRTPVHFSAMLKLWCTWWKSGRVQVDQMRGSMAQACDYINESRNDKAKAFDQHPIIMMESEDAMKAHVESRVVTEKDLLDLFDPFQPAKYEYIVAAYKYWSQCNPGREPRLCMVVT